MSNSQERY